MKRLGNLNSVVMKSANHSKIGTSKKKLPINTLLIGSIVGLFLSLCTMRAFGQAQNLSREQMLQDIDSLFSTIEKVHPDMYAVYPKHALEKDLERIKSELEPTGDVFYFYKQITPLVVKLGDGHTSVGFPYDFFVNVPDMRLFPFPVEITYPDKIVEVENDYTQTQNTIPIGAQITKINNKQIDDIVQEMMHYVSGEKDFFKIEQLKYLFTPLVYALYGDSIFDIEYLFNRNQYSVQVKGISFKERYERPQQNSVSSNEQSDYTFRTLPDKNIGILEFNRFADLDKFKLFLDSTFRVLQQENISNLIIDIRENGGGNSSLGDELFQYISPVPFAQFGKMIIKYSDILKQFYKTRNWKISNPNGIKVHNSKLKKLRKNKLRYAGNVFLLTSHYTFSSAADFAWAFKYFKMGSVIGEETGGLAVCFGDIITLELPNSGIFYSVSWKKFYGYGATDDNIHGTLPDYEVDAENALDFAIDLITK